MIVLDTHTLLWMDRDDDALGKRSRSLIEQAWKNDVVAVSAITFWECALLEQRGRIQLPLEVEVWRADLLQAGVKEIVLDGRIALLASALEYFPRDPADRFIAATALHYDALLLTADKNILDWQSALLRQNARK
ncbi:MAG: type II toxin-antitoxin system VapC family toxin [Desulfobacterales bacterium]|nr:type II toxin-antitoxin system VapC family toxin [Desulfobacterales bacterium]